MIAAPIGRIGRAPSMNRVELTTTWIAGVDTGWSIA
jgi:hypothetical protein